MDGNSEMYKKNMSAGVFARPYIPGTSLLASEVNESVTAYVGQMEQDCDRQV